MNSDITLMESIVKTSYLTPGCAWLYLTPEVVHALSDHYALNYHCEFSPSAHHATLALIRGTYLRLTHTVHLWPTFGR